MKRDTSLVMAGRRDHINNPITEVDLSFRVRPVSETVLAAHAVEIEST
jgi:hypothetical protein